jgi:hypothetical protein
LFPGRILSPSELPGLAWFFHWNQPRFRKDWSRPVLISREWFPVVPEAALFVRVRARFAKDLGWVDRGTVCFEGDRARVARESLAVFAGAWSVPVVEQWVPFVRAPRA